MSCLPILATLTLAVTASAAPLLAQAAAPSHGAHHRTAPVDWTRVVSATSEGGFRVGNPQAKVALVEYFSFTCPHCAAFSAEAIPAIRDQYVRTGKISFEMRSAVRDHADYIAAILAHCAGPARFFPMSEAIFAAQSDWETRAIDYDSTHPTGPGEADDPAAIGGFAGGTGLDAVALKHGLTPATLKRCYADPAAKAAVKQTTEDAWGTRKISGTPSFLINDMQQDAVHAWSLLQPRLDDAVKG